MDRLRLTINRIQFNHAVALLFLAIGVSMILSPTAGTMGWLLHTTGIPSDYLALAFNIAAFIIAHPNNSKRVFAICLFPLCVYGLLSAAYVTTQPQFSITAPIYITSLVVLLYALFTRTSSLPMIFGGIMICLGTSILAHPAAGAVGWATAHYGLPGSTFAVLLLSGAISIALFRGVRTVFLLAGFFFTLYCSITVAASAGMVGTMVALTMFFAVGWSYLRHE